MEYPIRTEDRQPGLAREVAEMMTRSNKTGAKRGKHTETILGERKRGHMTCSASPPAARSSTF